MRVDDAGMASHREDHVSDNGNRREFPAVGKIKYSALNDSLKEQGWKERTELAASSRLSRGDNSESLAVNVEEDEPDIVLKDTPVGPAPNAYVGKRNFIHQLMDVALMMANVSQLKALLASQNNDYFLLLLTFICLSICLQVVFTICMLIIWSIEKRLEDDSKSELPPAPCPKSEKKKWLANWLDRAGSILVLFIIVSNVFIAGFGVENHKDSGSVQQSAQALIFNNGSIKVQ